MPSGNLHDYLWRMTMAVTGFYSGCLETLCLGPPKTTMLPSLEPYDIACTVRINSIRSIILVKDSTCSDTCLIWNLLHGSAIRNSHWTIYYENA